MEWIFFAVGVAVIGVIGIALGLVLGRAVARRSARREGESDAFMTPIGPAGDGDEGSTSGKGDDIGPDAAATPDAVDGGRR